MPSRILVIANKSWEVDPLIAVLRSEQGKPEHFPEAISPPSVAIPLHDGSSKSVSARLAFRSDAATCEVWCVKDLMDPKKSSSSSEEKARVLQYITKVGAAPSTVVAFGTATLADQHSYNGSVTLGAKVFVHNPHAASPNRDSNWTHADVGKLLGEPDSFLTKSVFPSLDRNQRGGIESRFLAPPLNSARPPILLPSASSVALSNVNITNYDDYTWADPEALNAFARAAPKHTIGSIETTHGVIKIAVPAPRFMFVSGIANRLGYFNMEVAPRSYAQNFVASHNAGIALAWLMPLLMSEP